jgi:hypothetical protein
MSVRLLPHRCAGRPRLIGGQNVGVLVAASVPLLVCLLFVAYEAAYDPEPLWDRILTHVVPGVIVGVFLALASIRTYVRGDTVHVVSAAVTCLVPMSEIVGVDAARGMTLTLRSGRRVECHIKMTPRRTERLLAMAEREPGPWRQDSTVTVPRWTVIILIVALIAAMAWLSGLGPGSGNG